MHKSYNVYSSKEGVLTRVVVPGSTAKRHSNVQGNLGKDLQDFLLFQFSLPCIQRAPPKEHIGSVNATLIMDRKSEKPMKDEAAEGRKDTRQGRTRTRRNLHDKTGYQ